MSRTVQATGLFLFAMSGLFINIYLISLGCNPFGIEYASHRIPSGVVTATLFALLGALIFIQRSARTLSSFHLWSIAKILGRDANDYLMIFNTHR